MKMKSVLSGLIVVCAACMFLAASCSQASNKPTEETPMAIVNVRYMVDDVNTAIEFYTKRGKRRYSLTPNLRNIRTTSLEPARLAMRRAVSPALFLSLASAPLAKRTLTVSVRPSAEANISAVE